MSLVRIAVYWTMDAACNWTGHCIFRCYNGPGWINLTRAAQPAPDLQLDYGLLEDAGFVDAYLNIRGVESEEEAAALLRKDMAEYTRLLQARESGGEAR